MQKHSYFGQVPAQRSVSLVPKRPAALSMGLGVLLVAGLTAAAIGLLGFDAAPERLALFAGSSALAMGLSVLITFAIISPVSRSMEAMLSTHLALCHALVFLWFGISCGIDQTGNGPGIGLGKEVLPLADMALAIDSPLIHLVPLYLSAVVIFSILAPISLTLFRYVSLTRSR